MEKILFECKEKEQYLVSTECIDYKHPLVQEKVAELRKTADSSLDYIKRAYEFVRDEIPHSWDIGTEVVSRKASDVLRNKTGICWTNSDCSGKLGRRSRGNLGVPCITIWFL